MAWSLRGAMMFHLNGTEKERHNKTLCVHPDKDISDNLLVNSAIHMKKPILAICYGTQLVNVICGGFSYSGYPDK